VNPSLPSIPVTERIPSRSVDVSTNWLDRKRPNALNLFRLIFAIVVIFSHSWAFGKFEGEPLSWVLEDMGGAAGNAVNGFFIISGFLIAGSWLSRKDADSYLRARVARIWPAFAVAFVFSAAIAALAAGEDGLKYLRSIPKQSWFVGIFTLDPVELERALSFTNNPYPRTVNGPMWTIRIEFCCYMAVALVGVIGLFRRRWLAILFTAFAMSLAAYEASILPDIAWQRWARFAAFFGAGAVLYLYREQIPKSGWIAGACVLLICLTRFVSLYVTLPIAGTYLIFYLASVAPQWMKNIGAKNDISYGVYLYGGPLQQLYYSYAVKQFVPMNPWVCFAAVLPFSIGLGWLSWLYIEKPAKNWLK
jgi:peptidoglycan/LPS O-acetylase OafA/YrhL